MGTVAQLGAWTDWVSSELDDLLEVGSCALESCEVSVDLMETIGMTVLLARGRTAHTRVEHALTLLSATAEAWQDALDAVAALDPTGPAPGGDHAPAGPAGTTGPVGEAGEAEGSGHGVPGTQGGADPAGAAEPAVRTGTPFAGQGPDSAATEGPTGGSASLSAAPGAGAVAAVDGPGAAPSEQAQDPGPGTTATSAPTPSTDPTGPDTPGTGTAGTGTGGTGTAGPADTGPADTGPGTAGPGGAGPAGVSGPGAGSRWDRVRDRVPFHGAPVHGTLREWGFTERAWKKTPDDTCELSLTPAAGHVPYSDPVNDVFWVTATDDHGHTVEAHPLYSTRDHLAGPEHTAEPSTRQALRELVEDKGLPSALSASTKYGAATGLSAAAGIIAADGGHTAATVLSTGTGAVAGGVGLTTTWAARTIIAKRRGKVRDPTAPRTVRFHRPLDQMKNLHLHVQRGDHPRHARETAREHTLTLLNHHAQQHGIPEPVLRQARDRIQSLPRFPRGTRDSTPPDDCQRAALMHIPEGREQLVREFLGIDNTNGKR